MEGLLRKYKISKISDNVKLSKQELKICRFLDKTLIGMSIRNNVFFNKDDVYIFQFINDSIYYKNSVIYLSKINCYDVLNNIGLRYNDIIIVVSSWIEDLYKLKCGRILIDTIGNY